VAARDLKLEECFGCCASWRKNQRKYMRHYCKAVAIQPDLSFFSTWRYSTG